MYSCKQRSFRTTDDVIADIPGDEKLVSMDLSRNFLVEIDLEKIDREKSLEHMVSLAVASNNLTGMPSLPRFTKLEHLYMSHNELPAVDFSLILDFLPSLQTLLLNNNRITTLHAAKEPHLKLTHLSLSSNRLRTSNGFPVAPNLVTLGLFANELTEEEILSALRLAPKVSDLYVLGNDLRCDDAQSATSPIRGGLSTRFVHDIHDILLSVTYLDGQKIKNKESDIRE
eukprot:GEMP01062613.1.p1 GENE.GEMP01062613.1~~GEMP01062613.1.p1  ORF type:complete len:228 (+),score=37.15 GEMP01062613.1:149-832(+)